MRLLSIIIFLACPFRFISADVNDADRAFLIQALPVPNPSLVLLTTYRPNPSLVNLINKQIAAIHGISQTTKKGDVTLLIPFLDYTTSPGEAIFSIAPTVTEDLQKTKENWPAFNTILKNPHAKDELKAYALDKANPLDNRLASWLVLRYVDKGTFQDVSKSIDAEIRHSKLQIRNYASRIESGHAWFEGIPRPEIR